MLVEGLEEYHKTGILPNGERWSPHDEEPFDPLAKKFYVSLFTQMFCSKFNMTRETAISVLRHLENSGVIKIVWHSPKGSYFRLLNLHK